MGRLDIMVNNAGIETRTSVLDTTEAQYEKVMEINLKSAFFGTQLAAKQMIAQGGGGRIINISSVHEDWPMPGNAPYCLSKGGMRMLTRQAGIELGPHNILVVGVGPGAVATPINTDDHGGPGEDEDPRRRHPARAHGPARGDRQRGGVSGRGRRQLPRRHHDLRRRRHHALQSGAVTDPGMSAPDGSRHRVVIVGGGFGGLPAARLLGRKKAIDVTLVDRRNHHLFQPLLYQVATGLIPPGQIAADSPRGSQAQERPGRAGRGHWLRPGRRASCTPASSGLKAIEIPYDSLIVAAGVNQSYFGHDEFALYAPGMKTIDDALELRRRIFGAFEMAEMADDPAEQARWLTVAIVGAGPTGVELAGQIRELAVRSLRGEFRTFEASSVRVVLLDGGKEPLATFGDQLSGKADQGARSAWGWSCAWAPGWWAWTPTASISPTGRRRHPAVGQAHTTVWAAGRGGLAPGGRAGQGHRRRPGPGRPHRGAARPCHPRPSRGVRGRRHDGPRQPARRGRGGHARRTARRQHHRAAARRASRPNPFKYRDLGSAATIGRFRSVVNFRGMRLSGFPGWVVWAFVHLAFLTGFGNRLTTLLKWTRSFIGRGRPEREFSVMHTGGDLSLPT